MNELEKLKEAKHFYSKMKEEKYSKDYFKFNLSAFLSSARSILQYALNESENKTGSKNWYNSQVSGNKTIKFLKDERNDNIHSEPVSSKRDVIIHTRQGDIHMGDFALLTVKDKDGNIKNQKRAELQLVKSAVDEGIADPVYKFDNWTGVEDVFYLCQKYLDYLEIIIDNGKREGILT